MQNRKCIVFERRRDTGQRIHVCVFVSPVLILSSTNSRVDSSAIYSYSCRICPLEFFIVFRHKNKNNSSGQMWQLYAYVANESTCHLKPFVDPPSILVRFFIDERSAKGTYAAFILRLYPRFLILFLFMPLELLRSRMWVNINRPTTSRPRKFHKKSREASGANYREQSGRRRKSRNTVFVSRASGVAVWRWKSCLLLLLFLLPLLLFFLLRVHDVRACAKPTVEIPIPFWKCLQFVGSRLSILGHVCQTLSRLRSFVWFLYFFISLTSKLFRIAELSAK